MLISERDAQEFRDTANREVIDMWLEALRSGTYRQGVGALLTHTPEGEEQYCCLGVLCDLYDLEVADQTRWGGENNYHTKITRNYEDEEGSLPNSVCEWAGITNPVHDTLADLNDTEGLSFEQIANVIENLLK